MNSNYKFPCGVLASLALSLLVGCGGGGGGAVTPATIRDFRDGQAATAVIGAIDKNTKGTFLGTLAGNPAIGPDGKLYLPAYDRIYVYSNVPNADTSFANPAFEISWIGLNPQEIGLNGLQTIVFSGQQMIASDYTNNRVLIWDPAPTSDSATWKPKFVVGQPDLSNNQPGCAQGTLNSAASINVIAGNLVIADSGNNRVLIYDGIPTSNGVLPKTILGDTTDACNSTAPTSASTLNYPTDVAYDGTHLIVADFYNNRLLMWNTADIQNWGWGKQADMILGQPDASSNGIPAPDKGFNSPWAISTYGGRLAVGDPFNYRVLIWNTVPTCSGPTTPCIAEFGKPNVLGQLDLTKISSGPTDDKSIGISYGLSFTGLNQLIVNDNENRRFMIFNAP